MDRRTQIFSSWPGPYTWLLPASKLAPVWISGGSELVAVRVTSHPTVRRLCREFGGAIVSTSANLTGQPTQTNLSKIKQQFESKIAFYVDEPLGHSNQPSTIINGMTGQTIRG